MGEFSRVIVIGATSGIGREITRQMAESGCLVAAVGRRADRLTELKNELGSRVITYEHDVTNFDAIPELFQQICRDLGGLDLFVYNAGVMPPVLEPEYDWQKDKSIIDVNVSGAVRWLNEAAERFGRLGSGTLVGIGSVAGDRGRYLQPVYNASKSFLATYLESLRNRFGKLGVTVTTIKPGPVWTEMTEHMPWKNAMSAEKAAQIAIRKFGKGGEHYLSPAHALAFFVIRNIPSRVFRRIKI